ncbi:EPIDERMAL PATTERNING FACTOR-like protein 2 [Melia azedarach]|uniref:EPIDERMAL PATTERNING FACTOR-like protein 2 n=1 Tax=Melia azedarach TaxID=155640 RepID=A0ACC1XUM5_MELAZ|nr:EPIDERMAL PATTERNING FACTOR-like protein 2 [Melia azedarach]
MACTPTFIFRHRLCSFSVYFVFLLLFSSTEMRFMAQGRAHLKASAFSPVGEAEKATLRARIGSSPPKCERRCSKCGHCEAVQVPTNPQVQNGKQNSSTIFGVAYARGDDSTNYKPMSWKCKCGKFIFDP